MEQLWFNKYSPIDLLGSNNDAETYLALHVKLGEERFIKRIYKKSPYFCEIKKEAEILKMLDNAHIPRIYDVEEDDNYYYIIEQYIKGKSLSEFCAEQKRLSISKILELAFQICSILEYLHNSVPTVLHLDITSDNLLIAENQVFLVDFGNSLVKSGESCRKGKIFFGTKDFCAPELEKGTVDERTDIYAFGCIIAYLLKFTEESRGLKKLEKLSRRCCEREPERRFAQVKDIRRELSKLLKTDNTQKAEETECDGRNSRTITIGVMGAFKGAGATSISVMLAMYFRKKTRGKVAVAEISGHKDLKCMEKYATGFDSTGALKVKGVHFFSPGSEKALLKLRNEDFSYLIVDMGSISEDIPEELFRCDYKVFVTMQTPWKDALNERLENMLKAVNGHGWYVFINLQSAIKHRLLLNRRIKQIPIGICEEAFELSTKTQKTLKTLFLS